MTLLELVEEYERRRAEAAQHGSTAPLAKVYALVLAELRQVDGSPDLKRCVGTGRAAEILDVSPKTIRRWIHHDRFPGAFKTSDGDGGEWRLPLGDVNAEAGSPPRRRDASLPRLWEPEG